MRSSDIPQLTLLLAFSLAVTLAGGATLCGGSLRAFLSSDPLLVCGIFAGSIFLFCFLFVSASGSTGE